MPPKRFINTFVLYDCIYAFACRTKIYSVVGYVCMCVCVENPPIYATESLANTGIDEKAKHNSYVAETKEIRYFVSVSRF